MTDPRMLARVRKPSDHLVRRLSLFAGVAVAVTVLALGREWYVLLLPAGLMIGQAFTPYAEGYYLEGFGDGYDEGERLGAAAAGLDGGTDQSRHDRQRMGRALAGLPGVEPGAVDGAPGYDQQPVGAASPISDYREPATGYGAGRQTRNPVTEDGRAIPFAGPRPATFPDATDGGVRSLSALQPGGTPRRRKARSSTGARPRASTGNGKGVADV